MSRVVLIVTGARVLADSFHASEWARAVVRQTVDALPSRSRVLTGDARGPDEYAWEAARWSPACPYVVRYCLDGWVIDREHGPSRWTEEKPPRRGAPEWRRWPLQRNAALVQAATAWRGMGGEASVLALLAPWATTHGTEHTCGLAERAGLTVRRVYCPAEHAPDDVARARARQAAERSGR